MSYGDKSILNRFFIRKECFRNFFGYVNHSDNDVKIEYMFLMLEENHKDLFKNYLNIWITLKMILDKVLVFK